MDASDVKHLRIRLRQLEPLDHKECGDLFSFADELLDAIDELVDEVTEADKERDAACERADSAEEDLTSLKRSLKKDLGKIKDLVESLEDEI